MKELTLTRKLVLGGMAAVLVSIFSMGVVSTSKHMADLQAGAKDQMHRSAQDIAELIQLMFTQEMNMAKEISVGNTTIDVAARVARKGSENAAEQIVSLQRKLANAQKQIGENYEAIVVIDTNGITIADSRDGKFKGMEVGDRDYFKLAKQGKSNIGSVMQSKGSGQPVIPIAAPILTEQNELVGVLALIVKIDYLMDRVTKVKVGKSGYAFMVDQNGIVNAHPNRQLINTVDIKSEPGMEQIAKAIMAGETGAGYYTYRGDEKIAGYAPVLMTKWCVVASEPMDELRVPIRALQEQMAVIGGIILLVIAVAVFLLGRRITNPIARAAECLSEASDQVASASGQVSSASQELAEGASEQAAAIEETSSSLEEMSSMTKQNAANANEANNLMAESSRVVSKANNSMGELTVSIAEISKASEETSKIIKSIDEIAFQTNLLALNAAVEAARAGDAGAGFAVVADEVRNLAMRAADAAKNTANLIEGTVKKINEGSEIVRKTSTEFLQVAASAEKMRGLVGEIAAASNEQAQGIEQINRAVSEMDKVVQQNAANAEESASSSEEMNAQAAHMKGFIEDLVTIVGGTAKGAARGRETKDLSDKRLKARNVLQLSAAPAGGMPIKTTSKANNGNGYLKTASMMSHGRPEHLIPFDEAELRDF
jgi:methyl-accepting chemotaxis protein